MMQSLIEELKQLSVGVEPYDCHKKQKFNLGVAYCGQSMISWPRVFSLDGAFMEI
jgi:hypothetical protein